MMGLRADNELSTSDRIDNHDISAMNLLTVPMSAVIASLYSPTVALDLSILKAPISETVVSLYAPIGLVELM